MFFESARAASRVLTVNVGALGNLSCHSGWLGVAGVIHTVVARPSPIVAVYGLRCGCRCRFGLGVSTFAMMVFWFVTLVMRTHLDWQDRTGVGEWGYCGNYECWKRDGRGCKRRGWNIWILNRSVLKSKSLSMAPFRILKRINPPKLNHLPHNHEPSKVWGLSYLGHGRIAQRSLSTSSPFLTLSPKAW